MNAFRTLRRVALPALPALAALCLASAASALPIDPGDGGEPPPPPPPKPNLVFSAGSVTHGTVVNDWIISYTVANTGNAPAGAFRVSVGQDGAGLVKETAHASLAAGAFRSETIHLLRTSCYIAVRFTADSGRVVAESKETDNVRSAVDLTSPTCPTQPKYTVKAISFHANDETGWDWTGSDEPYWIFNGVGEDGTQHSTASHVFGDIDTGDTASFGPTEGCMYLSCAGGAAPFGMGFSVQAWESEEADVPKTLAASDDFFRTLGGVFDYYGNPLWLGDAFQKVADAISWITSNIWADDLVGTQTWTYSPTYLASRLPAVGGSFLDTRTYNNGDGGEYTMTTQVTRVG
jgi:CARDB